MLQVWDKSISKLMMLNNICMSVKILTCHTTKLVLSQNFRVMLLKFGLVWFSATSANHKCDWSLVLNLSPNPGLNLGTQVWGIQFTFTMGWLQNLTFKPKIRTEMQQAAPEILYYLFGKLIFNVNVCENETTWHDSHWVSESYSMMQFGFFPYTNLISNFMRLFQPVTLLGCQPRLKPNQAQARPGPQLSIRLKFWQAWALWSPAQAQGLIPSWAWHFTMYSNLVQHTLPSPQALINPHSQSYHNHHHLNPGQQFSTLWYTWHYITLSYCNGSNTEQLGQWQGDSCSVFNCHIHGWLVNKRCWAW